MVGYVVFLVCTVSLLPERMATHFDASGQPNGWGSRTSAVILQGVVGLVLPLMIAAAFCIIRWVPPQKINVPRRDFWFAPERRIETCNHLARQGLWLASLMVGLQATVWYQLIQSNSTRVPHLSSASFLVTIAVFGAAMIIWVISFFRHFAKTT